MTDWLFRGDYSLVPINVPALILGLLLAMLCGQVVAWVYMLTHSGLSYSRSFVNSLVVMPILVALVMQVLNNNLVTAFGLMAVFAIVRFRNILRDTLDTCYVLSVIVLGMSCGTQKFATAIIGCVVIVCVLMALWYTSFGTRHRYDLLLNLHWARPLSDLPDLNNLLDRHSLKAHCASQRSNEGYEGTDLSYRLLLRDSNRTEDLLNEVRGLQGVTRVTSLKTEEESEL
jgi:hypothetical protein